MINALLNENFDAVVANVPGLHVIRFWAEWCGPCRAMSPVFKDVAQELSDSAHFAEVDVDANPILAGRFGVQSIPTILLFRDGEVVDHMIGAAPKSNVVQFIARNLS